MDTRSNTERFEEAIEACRNSDAELFFQNLHHKIGSIYDAMRTMIQSMESQHGDKWEASNIELRHLENLKEMLLRDIKNRIPPSLRFIISLCPVYIKEKNKAMYTQQFNDTFVWDIIEPMYSFTVETFKYKLRRIRECMLNLNNQPLTDNDINNNGVYYTEYFNACPYLGNTFHEELGCKSPIDGIPDLYNQVKDYLYGQKKRIMSYLSHLIEFVTRDFAERNTDGMKDTSMYVRDLYQTLEFYMFFIGSKHYGPIGEFVKPLVDTLNQIITPSTEFKLIEIQNYIPSNYESCRTVDMMKPTSDKKESDKNRIIFVDKERSPNKSEIAKEELKEGGKSRRRTRRRNTRKRK
jgi:hypothetical protein